MSEMSSLPSSTSDFNIPIHAFISNITSTDPALRSLREAVSQANIGRNNDIAISDFAVLLRKLDVRGPCATIGTRHYIASGAQFAVHKQNIHFHDDQGMLTRAAIKFPTFVLDANSKLDISKPSVARQVRDLIIEISALRHPKLRHHTNIVDLLGWGLDDLNWHEAPFLALELADGDLSSFLKRLPDLATESRVLFLDDVARGLDAIHQVGLIHGDIKTDNILVFSTGRRWTAKLSDFGGGADLEQEISLRGRGTVGWRAPELRLHHDRGDPLDGFILEAIDAYSYGLLTWSLLCRLHGAPRGSEEPDVVLRAIQSLDFHKAHIPQQLMLVSEKVITQCLEQNPRRRISRLSGILSEACLPIESSSMSIDESKANMSDSTASSNNLNSPSSESLAGEEQYPWEILDIDASNAQEIESVLLLDPTAVTAEMAFATFLKQAEAGPLLLYNHTRRDVVLGLLSSAAIGGLIVAKALCARVHEYFGKIPEYVLEAKREEWLFDSIASGATFLTYEAQALDASRFESSMKTFRRSGGFNGHYSRLSLVLLHDLLNHSGPPGTSIVEYSGIPIGESINPDGDTLLHLLSSFDEPQALHALKQIVSRDNINIPNTKGETPLYRACRAGAFESTKLLLSTGADASIIPSTHGPGCLHWLFVFQSHQIDTITRKLIEAGASLEAQSSKKIRMMHYPFVLPLGSPLHWAVELSSKAAIIALLSCGANIHVRTHVSWGGRYREKTEEQPVLKHSSFDIATSNWDHEVLDLLLSIQSFDSIKNMDEHGFMASHKLHEKLWFYTAQNTVLYARWVRGPYNDQFRDAQRTIDRLLGSGFNLNTPTSSENSSVRTTALNLAVEHADTTVVEALLCAGVDPDGRDAFGRTALMCMKNPFYRLEPILQVKMLHILLSRKPNINTQDNAGHNALAYAALFGHTQTVSVLLAHDADPLCRIKDPQSNSWEGGMSVFVLLAPCDLDERLEQDKQIANILRDHLLPLLIDKNGHKMSIVEHELNDGDLGGTTILHYMAQYCHYESCSLLLSAGADVNSFTLTAGSKTLPGKRELRTPLAEALSYKTFQETIALPKRVSKSKALSILKDLDRTIELLRSWGGVNKVETQSQV